MKESNNSKNNVEEVVQRLHLMNGKFEKQLQNLKLWRIKISEENEFTLEERRDLIERINYVSNLIEEEIKAYRREKLRAQRFSIDFQVIRSNCDLLQDNFFQIRKELEKIFNYSYKFQNFLLTLDDENTRRVGGRDSDQIEGVQNEKNILYWDKSPKSILQNGRSLVNVQDSSVYNSNWKKERESEIFDEQQNFSFQKKKNAQSNFLYHTGNPIQEEDLPKKGFLRETFISKFTKHISTQQRQNIKLKEEKLKQFSDQKNQNNGTKEDKKVQYKQLVEELNSEWIDNLLHENLREKDLLPGEQIKTAEKIQQNTSNSRKSMCNHSLDGILEIANKDDSCNNAYQSLVQELRMLQRSAESQYQQLKSHTHQDYEEEMEKLRLENSQIKSNYREIQEENTKILHEFYRIKTDIQEQINFNKRIGYELEDLKSQKVQVNADFGYHHDSVYPKSTNRLIEKRINQDVNDQLLSSWVKKRLSQNEDE